MKQGKSMFSFKSIACFVFICGLAVLYVFQHIVITKLGYKIRQDEIRLEKLINEKDKLLSSIASLESPSNINKMIAEANLNLELSKKPRVVRIRL